MNPSRREVLSSAVAAAIASGVPVEPDVSLTLPAKALRQFEDALILSARMAACVDLMDLGDYSENDEESDE